MTPAAYKREREAALKLVNDVRKALGRRPVKTLRKGVPRKSNRCTIACSIDPNGFVSVLDSNIGEVTVRMHKADDRRVLFTGKRVTANRFISLFDQKKLPDLIKPR